MADNFPLTPGVGRLAATDQVTYSGDTSDVQLVRPVLVTGSEGSKTVTDLPGDGTNGLDVDVTRSQGFAAAGTAIGSAGSPFLVAGSDGTNIQRLRTLSDGSVLINGVQDAAATGTITSGTSTVATSVSNRNVSTISIAGTYAGVTFVIEGSDDGGTTYYPVMAMNNATGVAATTWTPGTNASASYDVAVGGFTNLRVRATAWTSGTANVRISSQVFAYEPVVAAFAQGLAAAGSAILGNPVLMGASDGTNARAVLVGTDGRLAENVSQINGVTPLMGNGVSGTGALRVSIASDSTGNIATIGTSVTPGTAATNLGKAEDAVHASGDVGVMALAVRQDTLATLSSGTGDYEPIHLDASGRVYVNAQGPVAHDGVQSGNPVRVAGRARTTDYTAVASDDVADLVVTTLGKAVVVNGAVPALTWNYAAPAGGLVTTTGVTAKTAAGVGIRNVVASAQVINSNQTTGTEVLIRDGAAGTVMHRGWAPPNGGYAVQFDPPLRGTANTLIEIAEVTATATAGVLVNLQGYTAAD